MTTRAAVIFTLLAGCVACTPGARHTPSGEFLSKTFPVKVSPPTIRAGAEFLAAPPAPVISATVPSRFPEISVPDEPEVNRFAAEYRNGKKYFLNGALARRRIYGPVVEEIFQKHGLPHDLTNLALLESGYNPNARSYRGAVGLWQFMAGTGRRYGLKIDGTIDERRDVVKASEAAAKYLSDLYEQFGDWNLAIAAFNCGEGGIDRAIRAAGTRDFFKLARIGGKLLKETREFVPRFLALSLLARDVTVYDSPYILARADGARRS